MIARALLLAALVSVPAAADPPTAVGFQKVADGVDKGKRDRRRKPPPPSLPENHRPVPLIRQATSYSCGAAAALGIFNYWDVYRGTETAALHEALETHPDHGTHPDSIVRVARRHGLRAELKEQTEIADLRRGLRRGQTIILDIQAWREDTDTPWRERWEDGHYVVLIGLDRHYAYFMDPVLEGKYGYIPLDELKERWHDYEDRTGKRREYIRAAIFISGGRNSTPVPRQGKPPELERIE